MAVTNMDTLEIIGKLLYNAACMVSCSFSAHPTGPWQSTVLASARTA